MAIDTNYFVCTLGEAALIKQGKPQPQFETINDFIDLQAKVIPDAPAVGIPRPSSHQDDKKVEWGEDIITFAILRRLSIFLAQKLSTSILRRPDAGNKEARYGCQQGCVALLCPSSADLLLTWLALIRMGFSVLLLAPQCQPSAIVHLCKTCRVGCLLYGNTYERLASEAAEGIGDNEGLAFKAVSLPKMWACQRHVENLRSGTDHVFEFTPYWPVSAKNVAYLHHTSGTSSGLPNPIPWTHHAAVRVLPFLSTGSDKATFTTTPLYHGGIADLFRAWTSGAMVWLFPGKELPITAGNILKSLERARISSRDFQTPEVRYFSSVPYILQMMALDKNGLRFLTEMEIVGVGGAALPASVGDDMVDSGVNLVSRFGSAECGFLLSSHRDYSKDQEWQYLRSSQGSAFLKFESRDDGCSEFIVLPGWPHMAKTNRSDGSLATADLFAPHPRIPHAWKYHSRADSQLTLITGKKFDPAPVEAAIATASLIEDVLIFGNGKPYPGALLFRSEKAAKTDDVDLIETIWPQIERLNMGSQDHSRLTKSMLVLIPFGKGRLEKSSKGTVLRGQAEKHFAQEIENAYAKMNAAVSDCHTDEDNKRSISDDEVPHAIMTIIKSVIGDKGPLADDTDFFSYGVDSVACMQIRTILYQRILSASDETLPLNVVYDCRNIMLLSKYLVDRRHGRTASQEDETQLMLDLVEEYSRFKVTQRTSLAQRDSTNSTILDDKASVVVLTGATGALGAHLLDLFRSCPNVSQIYCLVRGSDSTAAFERVNKSLLARKKAPLSPSSNDGKISCLVARLGAARLGLSDETYQRIASEATVIVHAAWAVNFSMRLRSFVKDHIAGIHNLLTLALSSPLPKPPTFVFCSSTASVIALPTKSAIVEQISKSPASASPLGYSRSKWVAESICAAAHRDTSLSGSVKVLRIGQLCGDTKNGVWNTTEAWPLMLDSVRVTETLPALEESLSWLPVDIAAETVLEIVFSNSATSLSSIQAPSPESLVYHVVNNDTTSTWSDLLFWLRSLGVQFDTIPPHKWVDRLENLRGDAAKHPAMKLVGLWKEAYCGEKSTDEGNKEGNESLVFSKDEVGKVSQSMRNVMPINYEQVARMWRWIQSEMMGSETTDRNGKR